MIKYGSYNDNVENISYKNNEVKLVKKNNKYVWAEPIHTLASYDIHKVLYRVGSREPSAYSGLLQSNDGFYEDRYIIAPGFYKRVDNKLYYTEGSSYTSPPLTIDQVTSALSSYPVYVPEFSVEPNRVGTGYYGMKLNVTTGPDVTIRIKSITLYESSFEAETISVNKELTFGTYQTLYLGDIHSTMYPDQSSLFDGGKSISISYDLWSTVLPEGIDWENTVYEEDTTPTYVANTGNNNMYSSNSGQFLIPFYHYHTYISQEGSRATCTEYGTTYQYCTSCGDGYYTTNYSDPPTGHNDKVYTKNDNWDPYIETWCRMYKCQNCNRVTTTSNHEWGAAGDCIYCTATQNI
jgi:hypothetical protein